MAKFSVTIDFENAEAAAAFCASLAQPTPSTVLAAVQVAAAPAPSAPPVAAAPAPVPTPPPAAAPAPAAPTPAHGPAPAGWTVDHVKSAATAFAANPAKGGPAALKAILTEFGAARAGEVDPARWPELYQRLTA